MQLSTRVKRLINFAYLAFLCLWLVNLSCFFIQGIVSDSLLVKPESKQSVDFMRMYVLGKISDGPDKLRLYDSSVQKQYVNAILPSIYSDVVDEPFIQYPPYVGILMMPLTKFAPNVAYAVWLIATVSVAIASMLLLLGTASKSWNTKSAAIFIVAVLSSVPAFDTCRQGQIDWLLLGGVALFCAFWLKHQDALAGAATTLIALKPQYSLLWLVPALGAFRWRLILAAFISELAVLAFSAIVLSPQTILQYPKFLFAGESSDRRLGVHPELMSSLRGPLSLLVHPNSLAFKIALAGWVIVSLALLVWILRTRYLMPEKRERVLLSISILTQLAFVPHAAYYDPLLLAVPAILLLRSVTVADVFKVRPRSLAGIHFVFILYPMLSWVPIILSGVGPHLDPNTSIIVRCSSNFIVCIVLLVLALTLMPHKQAAKSVSSSTK